MSRQVVKEMKRAVVKGTRRPTGTPEAALAKDCAEALLRRSIDFRHDRLAVIRLAMAVQAGADVLPEQWSYCRNVVLSSKDAALHAIYSHSARAARGETM